jgi:DNA replication and repair protein RecF
LAYTAAVHLAHLRLRDFRNYARLDADFGPGFHLLLGGNAQGKTNLLEAIYLLATLRSFRGVGGAQMIRHGASGFFVGARVVAAGTSDIRLYWSPTARSLTLNQRPVRRLTEYLGSLRAVVFCTEDLQLIKGPAARRRRFLDLLLTQAHPGYLSLLQRYLQALRARNALLKARSVDAAALAGFTAELVAAGNEIMRQRRELVPRLSALTRLAYRRIAHDAEEVRLDYAPSVKAHFAEELNRVAERERALRMTLLGPHRDELRILLDERPAAQFASEGQKRTLALAFKMAQAEYLTGLHGTPPVLLLDDVMGELDASRRAGLLPLLERAHHASGQVFMTCTEEQWPAELGRRLQRWQVRAGTLQPWPAP